MNLIITINNAQMRTTNEAKYMANICKNDNRKKNLERSEVKRRAENTLCRHDENPTDQQYEKSNLEQGEILPRFRSRESKRFSIGFETRGHQITV